MEAAERDHERQRTAARSPRSAARRPSRGPRAPTAAARGRCRGAAPRGGALVRELAAKRRCSMYVCWVMRASVHDTARGFLCPSSDYSGPASLPFSPGSPGSSREPPCVTAPRDTRARAHDGDRVSSQVRRADSRRGRRMTAVPCELRCAQHGRLRSGAVAARGLRLLRPAAVARRVPEPAPESYGSPLDRRRRVGARCRFAAPAAAAETAAPPSRPRPRPGAADQRGAEDRLVPLPGPAVSAQQRAGAGAAGASRQHEAARRGAAIAIRDGLSCVPTLGSLHRPEQGSLSCPRRPCHASAWHVFRAAPRAAEVDEIGNKATEGDRPVEAIANVRPGPSSERDPLHP